MRKNYIQTFILLCVISLLSFNVSAEPTLKETLQWIIVKSQSLCDVPNRQEQKVVFSLSNDKNNTTLRFTRDIRYGNSNEVHTKRGVVDFTVNNVVWIGEKKLITAHSSYYKVFLSDDPIMMKHDNGWPMCYTRKKKNAERLVKAFKHAINLAKKKDLF